MMAQNGLVVAGIDVAKDKADVSIRALSSTAHVRKHRRKVVGELITWLRKHKVDQSGNGGERRLRARMGQGAARRKDIEVRIVDPKRVRHFAQSAGRLAKNDVIDAEHDRLVCRDIRRDTEARPTMLRARRFDSW